MVNLDKTPVPDYAQDAEQNAMIRCYVTDMDAFFHSFDVKRRHAELKP